MKILFLFQRFHSNLIEIIKLHKDLGRSFDIHVKTYYKVEDSSFVKPLFFQEFFLTKYIKKIINFKTINIMVKNYSLWLKK